MNSINGLSVLKNSFTWKFSKYPRFHKKVKLQIQEKSEPEKKGLRIPWGGGEDGGGYTAVVGLGVSTPEDLGASAPGCISPSWSFETDKNSPTQDDPDYTSIHYSSISLETDGPLYENTVGYIEPPSPILLSYSSEDDVDEHIYDYVDHSSVENRPANIFLSLVDGEGTTISPDPNIYEVPPGAIFNSDACFEELFPLRSIAPPHGFQDRLTWERLHLITNNGDDTEAIYSLPLKFNLNGSAIVKSRKKKLRPGLEELLNQITIMKESATEEERKDGEVGEKEPPSELDVTKDVSLKRESTTPTHAVVVDSTPIRSPSPITITSCPNSNEVVVESFNEAVPSNLTVLNASVDSLPVEVAEPPNPETTGPSEPPNPKEFTSIIEILGDGSWNTAKILASHLETSKNSESSVVPESAEEDFLTASADARAKHVNLAYSGQYYCPVASIKPMKYDEDTGVDTKKNIGAQIMEKYEEERKKIMEIKNLPDVSLLDVDESLEEIQKERRKIIESQAVRAKRIDSWIKGRPVTMGEEEGENVDPGQESEDALTTTDPQNPESINMYLDENGEFLS